MDVDFDKLSEDEVFSEKRFDLFIRASMSEHVITDFLRGLRNKCKLDIYIFFIFFKECKKYF